MLSHLLLFLACQPAKVATTELPTLSDKADADTAEMSEPSEPSTEPSSEPSEPSEPSDPEPVDADGDGWPSDQDCDDLNPSINPDAEDIEGDGIDQDCDGADRPPSDDDGDGYTEVDGDCNDADPLLNPDAEEVCDGLDNDCNGRIDESGDCPCAEYSNNGKDYLFCPYEERWTDARNNCQAQGLNLVTIFDQAENDFLEATFTAIGSTQVWWIGFNDRGGGNEGNFSWQSGANSTYTNWHSGEPNNSNNEDCAEINRWRDGTWNDAGCNNEFPYICGE